MFTRRVLIHGKRSNLYLHNQSTVLTFSASSKSPFQLPPSNPPPVTDSPTSAPRPVTGQQFAPSQILPPNSSPGTNKEGATYEHNPENLWNNVVVLKCDSSSESGSCVVYLVGTCHVSTDSCKKVQAIIKHIKPQVVFLELCSGRLKSCLDAQARKVPTMRQIIYAMWKKKEVNIFATALSYFYTVVGKKLNVIPGAEFRVAYDEARSYGARIVLGDRPYHITMRRISRNIPLWLWTKTAYNIICQLVLKPNSKDVEETMKVWNNAESLRKTVEEINPKSDMSQELRDACPALPPLVEIIVNERDMYMSASLLEVSKKLSSVVVVVGEGHLEGIVKYWKQPIDTKRLMEIPTKRLGVFTGLVLATGLYFICMRLL